MKRYVIILTALLAWATGSIAVPSSRPFIWSTAAERDAVLERIATYDWADDQYQHLKDRADDAVSAYEANKNSYLRQLPLVTSSGVPKFSQLTETYRFDPNNDKDLQATLKEGQACAVMYYLTDQVKYAQCAADIFHNSILGLTDLTPLSGTTAGWIYASGLLGETQRVGHRFPIIYDYLYAYLSTGPTVNELRATGTAQVTYSASDFANAQTVFRTYHELVTTRGYANNNWSANMAQTLVPCVLALDDVAERTEKLKDYLVRDNFPRQNSLAWDSQFYSNPGDIWPETMGYSQEVNTLHSFLLVLLDRYDPSLNLLSQYTNIGLSISKPYELAFPNEALLSFGDYKYGFEEQPYFLYEAVYAQAKARNLPILIATYGPLINAGIEQNKYDRSDEIRDDALPLLWSADTVEEPANGVQISRTGTLAHSGTVLQRNLAPDNNPDNALMCVVGGGAHVHSHADGMDIELFGKGEILGVDAGKGDYGTLIHDNYYRVFAAHNTIIVNGASRGEGGWAGTAINTVQLEAMEPNAGKKAVSPNISYSCTSFRDDKGTGAEADQQRTLALIRTSPTTGYYVDIFRSESDFIDTSETHDYLYHNIGDLLEIETTDGNPLPLTAEPNRFQSDIGDNNEQPGWRYFEDVYNGASTASIKARFTADDLPNGKTYMDLHIPGETDREYCKVTAPPTKWHAEEYSSKRTPTLVVRKTGEAWKRPFAVVYEPHLAAQNSGTVQSVEKLIANGWVRGLKVVSLVNGNTITQYILSNPVPEDTYTNTANGFSFSGRFAVITDNNDGSGSLYMGDGASLTYGSNTLAALSGRVDANMDFSASGHPVITSNGALTNSPFVSPISDQSTPSSIATAPIEFTISHDQLPTGSLVVTATSSNTGLVANENIVINELTSPSPNRSLVITPTLNQAGTTEITVSVDDGTKTAVARFQLQVIASGGSTDGNTYTFKPTEDAYLQGGTRYNDSVLKVESGNRISYLKFNVTDLDTAVEHAELVLKQSGDSGNGTLRFYEGSHNNWTEDNLSTANAPSPGTQVGMRAGSVGSGQTIHVDVSPLVSGNGEYSVIIEMDSGGNDIWFSSKEGSFKPELKVTVTAPPVDLTPPAAPTGLAATPGDGSVALDWADNSEDDLAGYAVYRRPTSGSYGAPLAEGLANSDYVDNTAINGVDYFYAVTAVDTNGNESVFGSEAPATPQDSGVGSGLIAGWEQWQWPGNPEVNWTTTASYTEGAAGSATQDGQWAIASGAASTDGTFGSLSSPAADATNESNSDGFILDSGVNGYVDFTVTATGSRTHLKTFHFDAAPRVNGGIGATNWTLEVLSGDITTGVVDSGILPAWGGTAGVMTDVDVDLTTLADPDLGAGGTATFRLSFSGNASGFGRQTYLDNVGVSADSAPALSPPVIVMAPIGNAMGFSWSNDLFKVQSRTNLLHGDWFDVPGATNSPFLMTPTNAFEYYRLINK